MVYFIAQDEFKDRVINTHEDSKYGREYLSIIETTKIHFEIL